MFHYLVLFISLVVFSGLYFAFRKQIKQNSSLFFKIVSLALAVIFAVRYLLAGGSKLDGIYKLSYANIFSSSLTTAVVTILVWLSVASVVTLTLQPFFKFKIINNYAKTIFLVSNLLNFIFLNQYIYSYTRSYEFSACGCLIAIEFALSFLYCLYIFITNDYWKLKKTELKEYFLGLIILLVASMPPYTLSVFFGKVGKLGIEDFALGHRIYLYMSFVILFSVLFLLKGKDKEYKRMVLLYIAQATLISYISNYTMKIFISPIDWPLHLCNTAMFIVPLCLIFKWDKLFYFTFFINVLGAFFAMLMPSVNSIGGLFGTSVVKFWINHISAFAMPLLCVLLGVFERPKLKQFIYSMIAFAAYFALVLFLNSWLSNYRLEAVDFFYLNSDFIAEKLGTWAENLRYITISFNIKDLTFIFYPVYQALFFVVYVLLGLGMWFVYTWLFQIQDFYKTLSDKRRKIRLEEFAIMQKFDNKELFECMNQESVNKLVVKNLSKRYGNNQVFAIENVSFEVCAGEILGFLGPNGAGKSTTIKSIVGIQPQTSGNIEINGYDTLAQSTQSKMQFGFVPDHYALYENLTGREYLNYIADLYLVSLEERTERLDKLLKDLNMVNAIDNKIKTYSHGMKQKIAIMSALIHNPKLWILDEPLTGLDPISIYQVKECMRNHAKDGNIVFFSSHIIDVVEKLCSRIIILNNHHIEADVKLNDLKKKGISLEDFYLKTIGQDKHED